MQTGQVFHHIMLTLLGKKMCRKSRPALEPEQSGKVLWGAISLDGDQITFNYKAVNDLKYFTYKKGQFSMEASVKMGKCQCLDNIDSGALINIFNLLFN